MAAWMVWDNFLRGGGFEDRVWWGLTFGFGFFWVEGFGEGG